MQTALLTQTQRCGILTIYTLVPVMSFLLEVLAIQLSQLWLWQSMPVTAFSRAVNVSTHMHVKCFTFTAHVLYVPTNLIINHELKYIINNVMLYERSFYSGGNCTV